METHKVKYDLEKFPFHELVKKHFKWHRNLKYLNEWLRDDVPLIKELKYDQSTEFHRKFYTIYNESTDFLDLYTRFLKEVVQPCYDEPLVYQAKPSFRIHLPNNVFDPLMFSNQYSNYEFYLLHFVILRSNNCRLF